MDGWRDGCVDDLINERMEKCMTSKNTQPFAIFLSQKSITGKKKGSH